MECAIQVSNTLSHVGNKCIHSLYFTLTLHMLQQKTTIIFIVPDDFIFCFTEIIGTGDVVQVQNVTRYLDIIYTCAASNGHETINDYERRHHDIRIRVRCE